MRKVRAEIRMIPDTILKLIKTLGISEGKKTGRKLTNAEVVSLAIAKLTGKYVERDDGTYIFTPLYEICPDCSGLIDAYTFKNPPPNDEAHASEWRAIKRHHVVKCTWVTMAMSGALSDKSNQVVPKSVPKSTPNVVEMKYNIIDPTIEVRQEGDELITEDQTEIQVEDIKTEILSQTKPLITKKPTLDNVDFDGEETETYVDNFGKVRKKTKAMVRKVLVDDSDVKIGAKDSDNVSVSMEMGDSLGASKNQAMQAKMGGRESAQGKVTEKNVDDKTMILKTDVQGSAPLIKKDDNAEMIEKDSELATPTRVAKARITIGKNQADVGLDNMEFE